MCRGWTAQAHVAHAATQGCTARRDVGEQEGSRAAAARASSAGDGPGEGRQRGAGATAQGYSLVQALPRRAVGVHSILRNLIQVDDIVQIHGGRAAGAPRCTCAEGRARRRWGPVRWARCPPPGGSPLRRCLVHGAAYELAPVMAQIPLASGGRPRTSGVPHIVRPILCSKYAAARALEGRFTSLMADGRRYGAVPMRADSPRTQLNASSWEYMDVGNTGTQC